MKEHCSSSSGRTVLQNSAQRWAESRSRAALTYNLHEDFSRQSPNTKHNFWVLYLGLCEGASSGNKDHVHCARRKHFFSSEIQHPDFIHSLDNEFGLFLSSFPQPTLGGPATMPGVASDTSMIMSRMK